MKQVRCAIWFIYSSIDKSNGFLAESARIVDPFHTRKPLPSKKFKTCIVLEFSESSRNIWLEISIDLDELICKADEIAVFYWKIEEQESTMRQKKKKQIEEQESICELKAKKNKIESSCSDTM